MRTFQACPSCGRQYDVTCCATGERLRCLCGKPFGVQHPEPRAPRALRCSNCGGALRDAARSCDYCSAEITLEERRLDALCPGCGARMASDARFCMECGIEILPQALAPLREAASCPRCCGALRVRAWTGAQAIECSACGGLWLEPGSFERLCQRAEAREQALESLGAAGAPARSIDASVVRYLPCVRCGQPMNRRNFGQSSGILLDVCREHGLWLDHGELQRALAFAQAGGLVRARQREIERLEHERQRLETPALPPALPFESADHPRGGVCDILEWLAARALGLGRSSVRRKVS